MSEGGTAARGRSSPGPPLAGGGGRGPRDVSARSRSRVLLGRAIAAALRLLGATWRIRRLGDDPFATGQVRLGVLWHRDALMAAYCFRDRRVMLPVSLSRDGDLFDVALQSLGYAPSARGSSSRGGSGLLRQLIRGMRRGYTVAVLPDGPRGPARRAKPGVVALASAGGAPIYPVAFAARPALAARNWDRTAIPLPFARLVMRFGEPLLVPRELDDAARQELLEELGRRLDALRVEVDRAAGGEPDGASPRLRSPRPRRPGWCAARAPRRDAR